MWAPQNGLWQWRTHCTRALVMRLLSIKDGVCSRTPASTHERTHARTHEMACARATRENRFSTRCNNHTTDVPLASLSPHSPTSAIVAAVRPASSIRNLHLKKKTAALSAHSDGAHCNLRWCNIHTHTAEPSQAKPSMRKLCRVCKACPPSPPEPCNHKRTK